MPHDRVAAKKVAATTTTTHSTALVFLSYLCELPLNEVETHGGNEAKLEACLCAKAIGSDCNNRSNNSCSAQLEEEEAKKFVCVRVQMRAFRVTARGHSPLLRPWSLDDRPRFFLVGFRYFGALECVIQKGHSRP